MGAVFGQEDKSVNESTSTTQITPAEAGDEPGTPKMKITSGIITVSDRASKNEYEDLSGPIIDEWLRREFDTEPKPCIVGDKGNPAITYPEALGELDVIITTGGTGFGFRDTTPEDIKPLLEKEAPGIVHALLQAGLSHTPLAALSRPVAGVRGKTLIVTLPGSPKAVKENIEALRPLLPHIIRQLQNLECQADAHHKKQADVHHKK